jgi:hypothetical protein
MKTHKTPLPTYDDIARRAHALWLARGSPEGSAMDDWLEAERQLAGAPAPQPRRSGPRAPDEIDESELNRRLDDFGEPNSRSATSVD